MILIDTSGLIAALDRADPLQADAGRLLRQATPRILSPFVLAEADYLLARRFGRRVQERFLDEVASGGYTLESFDAADVASARAVLTRYADLDLGLTDASLVVLAERHGCLDVLTLDERRFRAVRGPGNRPFRILPAAG